MATNATNADVKVREVLAVAKELHAAQQQSMRLMMTYTDLLGKLPGELWTGSGILHVVDANRTVWCMKWNGGRPSVEQVVTVDIADEPAREPQETPAFPKIVYTEATEDGRSVGWTDNVVYATGERVLDATDAALPAMWREAQGL